MPKILSLSNRLSLSNVLSGSSDFFSSSLFPKFPLCQNYNQGKKLVPEEATHRQVGVSSLDKDAKTTARLRLFVATNRFETPTPKPDELTPLEHAQREIIYEDLLREFRLLEGEVLLVTDRAGLVASRQAEANGLIHFDYVLTDDEYTEFIHRFLQFVFPRYECFFVPIALENLHLHHYLRKENTLKNNKPTPPVILSYWVQESGLYLTEKDSQWMRFLWAWDGKKLTLVDWLGHVDPNQNLRHLPKK